MAEPRDLALRIEDLHKSFGDVPVLTGMSFEVSRGESFVILGPSGTGKSVTLRHIVGLISPDRGRVWVDRTEITGANSSELYDVRAKIGYLFQSGALINWLSVAENVALPLTEFTRQHGHRLSATDFQRFARLMTAHLGASVVRQAGLPTGTPGLRVA